MYYPNHFCFLEFLSDKENQDMPYEISGFSLIHQYSWKETQQTANFGVGSMSNQAK